MGRIPRVMGDRHAADLAEVVADIRAEGHLTLRAIGRQLGQRGTLTRQVGQWHVSTVCNLVGRLDGETIPEQARHQ